MQYTEDAFGFVTIADAVDKARKATRIAKETEPRPVLIARNADEDERAATEEYLAEAWAAHKQALAMECVLQHQAREAIRAYRTTQRGLTAQRAPRAIRRTCGGPCH